MKCKYRESYTHDGGIYFACKGGHYDGSDCEESYDDWYICNWYKKKMKDAEITDCIYRHLFIFDSGGISYTCSCGLYDREVCFDTTSDHYACGWAVENREIVTYFSILKLL